MKIYMNPTVELIVAEPADLLTLSTQESGVGMKITLDDLMAK